MMVIRRAFQSLLFLLLVSSSAAAQQAASLETVLARLRANVTEYRKSVPNFSADESVVSQIEYDGKVRKQDRLDSGFRVSRAPDHTLHEIRVAPSLNGRAVTGRKLSLPYRFSGGFADMPALLTSKCGDFRLAQTGAAEPGRIVLLISNKAESNPDCGKSPYTEKAVIDASSFQVLRFEHHAENVEIKNWLTHLPFVLALSKHNVVSAAVDYAPVKLGGNTFWLPSRVTSTATDKSKPLTLRYEASYSNFKLFTSSVTITPADPAE